MTNMNSIPPDPYLGEIRIFCGNFPPQNWELCDGKLYKIADYQLLFGLIHTTYGGDGVTTFGVPDLQGRIPISIGPSFPLGTAGGESTIALTWQQMPTHSHTVYTNNEGGNNLPNNNTWGFSASNPYSFLQGNLALNRNCIPSYGKGQAHENRIPYQALNYIIAMLGRYPTLA